MDRFSDSFDRSSQSLLVVVAYSVYHIDPLRIIDNTLYPFHSEFSSPAISITITVSTKIKDSIMSSVADTAVAGVLAWQTMPCESLVRPNLCVAIGCPESR